MAERSAKIDAYIAKFPPAVRKQLEALRAEIRKTVPEAVETISYGIPTFKLNGNLVHFAGYEGHIGFYPTSSPMKAFAKDLSKYETSKGTVRFSIEKPLPLPLIRRIVRFRVAECRDKRR